MKFNMTFLVGLAQIAIFRLFNMLPIPKVFIIITQILFSFLVPSVIATQAT
jgi:hypothetical protein